MEITAPGSLKRSNCFQAVWNEQNNMDSTDILMIMLPMVFMLHDFEEIIMKKAWQEKNFDLLNRCFPKAAALMNRHDLFTMSTSAFAFAVCIEFILISAITLVAVLLRVMPCGSQRLWRIFCTCLYISGSGRHSENTFPVLPPRCCRFLIVCMFVMYLFQKIFCLARKWWPGRAQAWRECWQSFRCRCLPREILTAGWLFIYRNDVAWAMNPVLPVPTGLDGLKITPRLRLPH